LSRLTDLIDRVQQKDPALAKELTVQVRALLDRREFGLNFERHAPETVQLPGRRLRRGDKVLILPKRAVSQAEALLEADDHGALEGAKTESRLWLVTGLTEVHGKRAAKLLEINADGEPESQVVPDDDLMVAASFRDPIYPGFQSTGRIDQGGDSPAHVVINGENFHALEALRFPLKGRVDVIYIDPPYNTRDKDWKYNNDYVDSNDSYRHSKWLAFMERRLQLARVLLNPNDSVLMVTIDEKEYLRLGLLLDQIFPDARIQMVSTLTNPANSARPGAFARGDEYIYFVMFGAAGPVRMPLSREWVSAKGRTFTGRIRWDLLRRSGTGTKRSDSPGGFYPIYINPQGPTFHSVGASPRGCL